MADATLPGFRKAPLGNHRYRNTTERAVVELIPHQQPGYWHLAVFRDGHLRCSYYPKPAAMLPSLLSPLGLDPTWKRQWHRPYQRNPYLDVQRQGFVYYVEAEEIGLTKIGTSRNVRARLNALQDDMPFALRVVFTCTGDLKLESALHRRFAQHRKHGEWFYTVPELMTFPEEIQNAQRLYDLYALPWQELERTSAVDDSIEREAEYDQDPRLSGGYLMTVRD